MNKTELVEKIAEKSDLSKKDAEKALNAFIDAVTEAVAKDDKVQLIGFGTFERRRREERAGRDPRTGNPITSQHQTHRHLKQERLLKKL